MELTGKLKKQVENAQTREEAKGAIAEAGMLLDDNELDLVAGGDDYLKERHGIDELKDWRTYDPGTSNGTHPFLPLPKHRFDDEDISGLEPGLKLPPR